MISWDAFPIPSRQRTLIDPILAIGENKERMLVAALVAWQLPEMKLTNLSPRGQDTMSTLQNGQDASRGFYFRGSRADGSLVSWNLGEFSSGQNIVIQVPCGLLKN